MTRPVEVYERVAQWREAFDDIRREITSDKQRAILAEMEMVEGVAQLQSYMSLARNVMANDRAAATVAAMLVATGIKPTPTDYENVNEVT